MYEHEFTGRRPSIVQIKAVIKKALAAGAMDIYISWGENRIRLEKQKRWTYGFGPWAGEGWLGKGRGGQDIANEMNEKAKHEARTQG